MRTLKVGLAALVVLGGVAAVSFYATGRNPFQLGGPAGAVSSPAAMAMPVPITDLVRRTLPIYLEYAARTESIRNISLQARVAGYVQSQDAADGADVKAGQLLYRIDPRDLQAALDQANAQEQRDSAALDYARENFDRGRRLVTNGFVTRDAYEQRESALAQAQAALAADRAAIRTAQLNLSYAQIRAPFAGRLGRNQAPLGALVSVAGNTLNTLVQLDPIYVTFNPSETDLAKIQQARSRGSVRVDVSEPGAEEPIHSGELTFLDNVVDRNTGTIVARATVDNHDFSLLPGAYVRVRVHVEDEPNALMAPRTAIGSSQLGQFVYVVGAKSEAVQRLVTLGSTNGALVDIVKGVSPSDRIITGNLQKIGPGSLVRPLSTQEPPA